MIPLSRIDRPLAFFGFIVLIGALNAPLTTFDSTVGGSNSAGNLNIQILSLSVYLPSIFLIFHRIDKFTQLLSNNIIVFVFLLIPMLSILWSVAPDVSVRRVVALLGTTLFVAYIAIALPPQQALRILAAAFATVTIVSLVFAVGLPRLGTHEAGPYSGVWRGIFAHKNKLGGMMTLAAATIAICPKYTLFERIAGRTCVVIAIFLVAMSQSKTALVILLSAFLLIPIVRWISGRGLRTITRASLLLLIGFAAAMLVARNAENILDLLGKDPTLTGRTETWSMAWENALKRPILGYGYRVFWTDKTPARLAARESWRDKISHSHNSYLDLLLDLGFLGVVMFVVVLVVFSRRLLRRFKEKKDSLNIWMSVFFFYMLVVGITERSILEQSDIVWSIFIMSYFYLSYEKKKKKNEVDEDVFAGIGINAQHRSVPGR